MSDGEIALEIIRLLGLAADKRAVLDIVGDEICFKCTERGCGGWCDYSSPASNYE